MNRNQVAHFSDLPEANIPRSRFDLSQDIKYTANFGELVPFYCQEIYPGDTMELDTSKLVRLQTLLTPVMSDMMLDTYYFFVPNRLVWDHWEEFCGENKTGAWYPQVEYSIPQIRVDYAHAPAGVAEGSILDYLGVPTKVAPQQTGDGYSFSALPVRGVIKIFNDWFRDENLVDPVLEYKGDNDTYYDTTSNASTAGGDLLKAAKVRDYFTSCLPNAQKGLAPGVPIYQTASSSGLPIIADPTKRLSGLTYPARWSYIDASGSQTEYSYRIIGDSSMNVNYAQAGNSTLGFAPENLYATSNVVDSTGARTTPFIISISDLRYASAVQRMLEMDARMGTRYIEYVRAHFGVLSEDARLQRAEYLGGNRIPISVHQIQNQAQSSGNYLGDLGAMSLTTDRSSDVFKSFTEHGFVIGIAVARYFHSYQNGLERFWSRKTKYSFYDPIFANLSEMGVKNKEIYLQGTDEDDEIFGYQECWGDLRYRPDRIAGEMRSNAQTPLDSWHLADEYDTLPSLSSSWIAEDKTNVDRTLAVTSSVSNQLFMDFYVDCKMTRPLPMFGIPGLGSTF